MPLSPDEDYINPEYAAKKAAREPLMRAIMEATTDEERWERIQALDERAVADGSPITVVIQGVPGRDERPELDED